MEIQYKEDPSKYTALRCVLPGATETNKPWFPIMNVCPCDPRLSNTSGRGIMPCPFGIQGDIADTPNGFENLKALYLKNNSKGLQTLTQDVPESFIKGTGSMYQNNQYNAPQMDPRALVQIGYTWRS